MPLTTSRSVAVRGLCTTERAAIITSNHNSNGIDCVISFM